MQTTIAFKPTAVGNDHADLPACLLVTITDALRQKILTAQTVAREHGFRQVMIDHLFRTPTICSNQLEEDFEDGHECVSVDPMDFDETPDHRVSGQAVVVDATDLWLRCYDHYGDFVIESSYVSIRDALSLQPQSSGTTGRAG